MPWLSRDDAPPRLPFLRPLLTPPQPPSLEQQEDSVASLSNPQQQLQSLHLPSLYAEMAELSPRPLPPPIVHPPSIQSLALPSLPQPPVPTEQREKEEKEEEEEGLYLPKGFGATFHAARGELQVPALEARVRPAVRVRTLLTLPRTHSEEHVNAYLELARGGGEEVAKGAAEGYVPPPLSTGGRPSPPPPHTPLRPWPLGEVLDVSASAGEGGVQQQQTLGVEGAVLAEAGDGEGPGEGAAQALSAPPPHPFPGNAAEGEVSSQVRGVVDLLARRQAKLERGGGGVAEGEVGGAL